MVQYLAQSECDGGGWDPLWFGSQYNEDGCNRTHGTARVVFSLLAAVDNGVADARALARRGGDWLLAAQGDDGGWGGVPGELSSIEETSLAVVALARLGEADAVARAIAWLAKATSGGRAFPAAPIGLYFDQLWYSEQLYPITFCLMAALAAEQLLASES
jgi:hypothetical protein